VSFEGMLQRAKKQQPRIKCCILRRRSDYQVLQVGASFDC
jgi:hypothetical protein